MKAINVSGDAFLGVNTFDNSKSWIYVLVKDRTVFDTIAITHTDSGPRAEGRVLTKAVEQNGHIVIFQYWPEEK